LKQFGVDAVQGYFLERPRWDHPLLAPATRLRSGGVALRFT
jgi:EAL domain-containing protein (putative c-di-GMP-specific phosphodiesterase class I)